MGEREESERLRVEGNRAFTEGRLKEAAEWYSRAIDLTPTVSTLYSNRSRCLLRLGDFAGALHDAQRALEEDMSNIKAHLLLGTSLCELAKRSGDVQQVETAVVRLRKALGLCSSQNLRQLEGALNTRLLRALKLKWYLEKEHHEHNLAVAERDLRAQVDNDPTLSDAERRQLLEDFAALADRRYAVAREIPAYLCCPLSGRLLADPVLLASGGTFERTAALVHLQASDRDPLTGSRLSTRAVAPNLNLRQAVEAFLAEQPWAFELAQGDCATALSFAD